MSIDFKDSVAFITGQYSSTGVVNGAYIGKMNKYFNSTDLSINPALANYSLIISGNFTSTSYMYDFDWSDYDAFYSSSAVKMDHW